MPKHVSPSLHGRLAILTVVSLALSGALAAPSVLALWGEPGVAAPGGTLAPPVTTGPESQTRVGALTVSQGTLSGYGRSTFLGAGDSGGVTVFGLPYQYQAGIRGIASSTAGGLGKEIGVYGLARTNQGATVGVVGFDGGYLNAYAGFFYGSVAVSGNLGVGVDTVGSMTIGQGLLVRGLTVPTAPGTITAEATSATGKSAVAATQVFNAVYSSSTVAAATGEVSAGTCPVGERCAGVYGSDGSVAVDIAGRWAGYFNGNVNVQGTVYLNGSPVVPSRATGVSPPQFQNIPPMTPVVPGLGMAVAVGSINPARADSSLGYDGQFFWMGASQFDIGMNAFHPYLLKVSPVSVTGVGACRILNLPDNEEPYRFAFDGSSLWFTTTQFVGGTPIGSYKFFKAPIAGMQITTDPNQQTGNCNATQVPLTFGGDTYRPYATSTPWTDGTSVWISAYRNGTGHYLVELDPQSLAVRGATAVGDTNDAFVAGYNAHAPKGDAQYIWVPVVVGGDSKIARLTRSDRSVLVKDFSSANCPAANPACLSYKAVGVGGGYVWAAALEGADDVNSRQRLLKIDSATGNLIDAYPGGYGGGVLYDGAYVWTSTKTYGGGPAAVLYRFRVSDSSIATKDGVSLGTESTFDGSYIYTSSGGSQISKILR